MNNFENKVLKFIRKNNMVEAGDTLLIGFSGGADSTALVTVLASLKEILSIKLIAAHVNHGIRDEAYLDAEFTRKYCEDLGIKYFLLEENIPKIAAAQKLSEEEAGRIVRYEFFNKLLKENKADKIAIAHHENDAAETFLLNIFRGSGVRGGSGIRPVRDNVIRPLLCVSRDEIENYLAGKGISYCTDATNTENIHTRNKIRNVVIPYIQKEINNGAVDHIYRATSDFAQADEYIRNQAGKIFDKALIKEKALLTINLEKIKNEPEIIRKYIVMKCFEKLTPNRKDITARHIDAVTEMISDTDGTAFVDLPYNLVAVRSYSKLSFAEKKKDADFGNADEQITIKKLNIGDKSTYNIHDLGVVTVDVMSYNGKTSIPRDTYTKWFDCDRIQEVVLRHRKPDDYICIEQGNSVRKKKLSKFMTDEKVPVSDRDNLFILADGSHCMWVPGYRISCSYKVSDKTKKILAISISNGGN